MSELDEESIGGLMRSAVPDPPSSPDRAEAARRRSQQARTARVGVAAAAIVVGGIVGAAALLGSDTPSGADPVDVTPGGFSCPAGAEGGGSGEIPTGAVAVHLCPGEGNGFQVPGDALTTGVDGLAQLINDLPVQPPPRMCTEELGIGYQLVFVYAGGQTVSAAGEMYGCAALTVDGTERENPRAAWDEFIRLLRDQRAAAKPPPPTDVAAPGCDDGRNSPIALATEMTRARLCVLHPNHPEKEGGVTLRDEDLFTLLADRAVNTSDRAPDDEACLANRDYFSLVGVTPWGDRVVMTGYCGLVEDYGGMATDSRTTYWRPGSAARAILDRLVVEARASAQ